jgi:hypothetical protein
MMTGASNCCYESGGSICVTTNLPSKSGRVLMCSTSSSVTIGDSCQIAKTVGDRATLSTQGTPGRGIYEYVWTDALVDIAIQNTQPYECTWAGIIRHVGWHYTTRGLALCECTWTGPMRHVDWLCEYSWTGTSSAEDRDDYMTGLCES